MLANAIAKNTGDGNHHLQIHVSQGSIEQFFAQGFKGSVGGREDGPASSAQGLAQSGGRDSGTEGGKVIRAASNLRYRYEENE